MKVVYKVMETSKDKFINKNRILNIIALLGRKAKTLDFGTTNTNYMGDKNVVKEFLFFYTGV